jgi:hypothetical protein
MRSTSMGSGNSSRTSSSCTSWAVRFANSPCSAFSPARTSFSAWVWETPSAAPISR